MKHGINLMKRYIIIFALVLSGMLMTGCSRDADVVTPGAVSTTVPVSPSGTIYPQLISVYPENSATGIPVDTDIVLVFSKPIDTSTVTSGISISPAATYAHSLISGGRGVVITPDSDLNYGTTYTVTISTDIEDTNGNALTTGGSFTFTTAADNSVSLQPRVINGTQYPSVGATGVPIGQPYVEVTFTEEVDNVTNATFTVYAGALDVHFGAPTSADNKTWRLQIDTALADYSTVYTVTLTTAIYKLGDATSTLYDNGYLTWSYTTVADQASAAAAINDIWVESITDDTAVINFTTSKPYTNTDSYIEYDTDGAPFSWSQVDTVAGDKTFHTITLSGLNAGTLYYFRGWLDLDSDATVDPGDAFSSLFSFRTVNDATVNDEVSSIAGDQDELVLLQTNGAGSYAFWVSGGGDIYGQFFSAGAGTEQWGDGGASLSTPGTQNGIIAISDGFNEAILVYNDTNNLYSKMVDTAGLKAAWGYAAGDQGRNLGLAIKAGSSYSACIVHERPDIISSGIADMPANGVSTNLLFDADTDFSALGLADNDLLIWDNGGTWTSNVLYNTDSFNIYRYVLRSDANISLNSYDYYLAEQTSSMSGSVDSIVNATTFQADDLGFTFGNGNPGDAIHCNGSTWAIIVSKTLIGGFVYEIVTNSPHGLSAGQPYIIYPGIGVSYTSEAVTNPLWDADPIPLFNPGTTILTGDYVVNENNNTAAASCETVSLIDLSRDTDYALRLSADIMNNNDIYSIIRMPLSISYRNVGYTRPGVPADFTLTDTFADYVAASVVSGDIVYNIDNNLSAMVLSRDSGTQLTLSADIFNAVNNKYIIYQKRGFLVAYVDASDYIRARAFNVADGSALGAAFNVCTNGTNSDPVAVSDGAGNAIIFYEKSGNIYVKKVSAKGEFFAAWGANADQASDAGITVVAGYTIVQALPDMATGGTGGAYLLADNGSGSFQLIHVAGSTGGVTTIATVTGYNPQMAVDYDGGAYNRVIIVSRSINTIYYYIQARGYRMGGGLLWGPVNVSLNTATYNCVQPSITMDNNTAAADGFYVAWFDARYFNPSGYTIYAKRYDSSATLVAPWDVNGVLISTPTSLGYDHPLYMRLLYNYDNIVGAPYGLLPIWLDYRTYATTGTDIYYQRVNDSGALIP